MMQELKAVWRKRRFQNEFNSDKTWIFKHSNSLQAPTRFHGKATFSSDRRFRYTDVFISDESLSWGEKRATGVDTDHNWAEKKLYFLIWLRPSRCTASFSPRRWTKSNSRLWLLLRRSLDFRYSVTKWRVSNRSAPSTNKTKVLSNGCLFREKGRWYEVGTDLRETTLVMNQVGRQRQVGN